MTFWSLHFFVSLLSSCSRQFYFSHMNKRFKVICTNSTTNGKSPLSDETQLLPQLYMTPGLEVKLYSRERGKAKVKVSEDY